MDLARFPGTALETGWPNNTLNRTGEARADADSTVRLG